MLVKVQENGFGRDLYTLSDPNTLTNFLFVRFRYNLVWKSYH